MLNFKPEGGGGGDLVESSDDLEGLSGGVQMEESDIDSDFSDDDDDTDADDISDIGEEAGKSQTEENPFFNGSDSDGSDISDDSEDEDDEETKAKIKAAEGDEDDDLIKALKAARQKKERNCPPDIKTSELITDISFHPASDLIALDNLSVFKFSNEKDKLQKKLKLSKKTLRGLEFDETGLTLLTISKDKTFRILDTETWAVK
mgnify:CR=1 FL=1